MPVEQHGLQPSLVAPAEAVAGVDERDLDVADQDLPATAGVASRAMPSSWLTNCTFDHLTSTIAVSATHALRVRLSTMCSLPSALLPA
jgi:hypothetical protein